MERMLALAGVVLVGAVLDGVGCCPSADTAHDVANEKRWLVLAPHPDDEALIASGVIVRAVQSRVEVSVAVMTNGDLDCLHDGLRRERESVAGMAVLGLPEDRIHFLGYPDGGLALLGRAPLPRKRIIDGACVTGDHTYAAHGFGGHDAHSVRTGSPASYTRDNAIADLAALLANLRPTDVVTTHPEDTHPDHAATYMLLRSAIDRLDFAPRVHRAIVHNDDCWPLGIEPHEPCFPTDIGTKHPTPPLTGRLAGYVARERIPVPDRCRIPDPKVNLKLRAIAAHASQTRSSPDSYLFSFARSDEMFFPETFVRSEQHWLPIAPGNSAVGAPFVATAEIRRPEEGAVTRIGSHKDERGTFSWTIESGNQSATLARPDDGRGNMYFRRWLLPHDLWAMSESETFTIAIDPHPEDSAAEVSLRVGGNLVGLAIDVRNVSAYPSVRHGR